MLEAWYIESRDGVAAVPSEVESQRKQLGRRREGQEDSAIARRGNECKAKKIALGRVRRVLLGERTRIVQRLSRPVTGQHCQQEKEVPEYRHLASHTFASSSIFTPRPSAKQHVLLWPLLAA